ELICLHQPDGTYLYVSPSIKSISGFSPEELLGKSPYEFFHPQDQEFIRNNAHASALKGKENVWVEYRFRCKDDHYIWLQTLTKPVKDSSDQVIQLVTSSRDITLQKEVEQQLIQSEKKFSDVFYFAGVGMALTSLEGQFLEVNEATSQILGYSKEELIQKTLLEITHPEDLEPTLKMTQLLIQKELFHYSLEKRFFHQSGKIIWVILSVTLIHHLDGSPLYFLSQIQDITSRKMLELELEKQNQKLKTASDIQFRKNKQLEEFNQIVSHNLRSPAGSLKALVDLFEGTQSESEKVNIMEMIKETSLTLNTTLNDLMEILKVQQEGVGNLETLSFEKILEQVKKILRTKIVESEAVIQGDFSGAPEILYSRIYLESILLNLISNALKYHSPLRKPLISLKTNKNTLRQIILEVEDNGLGMDLKKYGQKLFKMNQTFHQQSDSKGIGLFMTKNHIESMGGSITASSEENKGTRFTVHFHASNYL
ncbi:MAG: PAS domain S-box protein, partial [Chitinophagaceae bacterium]